jgi:hypothetical protein
MSRESAQTSVVVYYDEVLLERPRRRVSEDIIFSSQYVRSSWEARNLDHHEHYEVDYIGPQDHPRRTYPDQRLVTRSLMWRELLVGNI